MRCRYVPGLHAACQEANEQRRREVTFLSLILGRAGDCLGPGSSPELWPWPQCFPKLHLMVMSPKEPSASKGSLLDGLLKLCPSLPQAT